MTTSLETKLDMTISGYSLSEVGLWAYILGRSGLLVTEEKLTEILGEGIIDFMHRFRNTEKSIIATAVTELIKLVGLRQKPDYQTILNTIIDVDNDLGTMHDREALAKIARYLFLDWSEIQKSPGEGEVHIMDFIDMYTVDT